MKSISPSGQISLLHVYGHSQYNKEFVWGLEENTVWLTVVLHAFLSAVDCFNGIGIPRQQIYIVDI